MAARVLVLTALTSFLVAMWEIWKVGRDGTGGVLEIVLVMVGGGLVLSGLAIVAGRLVVDGTARMESDQIVTFVPAGRFWARVSVPIHLLDALGEDGEMLCMRINGEYVELERIFARESASVTARAIRASRPLIRQMEPEEILVGSWKRGGIALLLFCCAWIGFGGIANVLHRHDGGFWIWPLCMLGPAFLAYRWGPVGLSACLLLLAGCGGVEISHGVTAVRLFEDPALRSLLGLWFAVVGGVLYYGMGTDIGSFAAFAKAYWFRTTAGEHCK